MTSEVRETPPTAPPRATTVILSHKGKLGSKELRRAVSTPRTKATGAKANLPRLPLKAWYTRMSATPSKIAAKSLDPLGAGITPSTISVPPATSAKQAAIRRFNLSHPILTPSPN